MKQYGLDFIFISLIYLQTSWIFGDDPRRLEQEESQQTTITVDRARKLWEAEQYRLEKQADQDRLRNTSNMQSLIKAMKEEERRKARSRVVETEETEQEKFLREKSKAPEETVETIEEKTEEKKALETEKKNPEAQPLTLPVESLEEQEKKENYFYQTRLLVNYRSPEEGLMMKEKIVTNEEEEPAGVIREVEEILDNIPFIREMSLNPYAFESDVLEPD